MTGAIKALLTPLQWYPSARLVGVVFRWKRLLSSLSILFFYNYYYPTDTTLIKLTGRRGFGRQYPQADHAFHPKSTPTLMRASMPGKNGRFWAEHELSDRKVYKVR